jgi:hypothetical protein
MNAEKAETEAHKGFLFLLSRRKENDSIIKDNSLPLVKRISHGKSI